MFLMQSLTTKAQQEPVLMDRLLLYQSRLINLLQLLHRSDRSIVSTEKFTRLYGLDYNKEVLLF